MHRFILSYPFLFFLAQLFGQDLSFDTELVLHIPVNQSAEETISSYPLSHSGFTYDKDRNGGDSCALHFNGSTDYLEVQDFTTELPLQEITVSFWIKPDLVKSQNVLMLMPNDETNRMAISAYYSHHGVPSHFWDFGSISSERLEIPNIKFDTNWHFLVCTSSVKGNKMSLYLDGVLLSSINRASTFDPVVKLLRIGGGKDANFSGSLDDVRIYSKALNQSEILQLMVVESCIANGVTPRDTSSGFQFQIYPNPATTHIIVDFPDLDTTLYVVRIHNAIGQLIFYADLINERTVIVLDYGLAAGLYEIDILRKDFKARYAEKFVIIR